MFQSWTTESLAAHNTVLAADFNGDKKSDLLRCDARMDCNGTAHYLCTVYLEAK